MKRITLMLWVLGFIFSSCLTGAAWAELPKDHDKFWDNNASYKAMYDLYDLAQMNAYNQFDEQAYAALEKNSETAIAESVKKAQAAGKSEADAYAAAYGEQVIYLDRATTWKLAGDNPLEGFYRLESETSDGYLAIFFDKDNANYDMSIFAWSKADPAKSGRCYAQATELKEKFTTSGVQNFEDIEYKTAPDIQLELSIEGGVATVKTTDTFKKGNYVRSGVEEDTVKSEFVLDGKYVLNKKP